MTAVDDGIIELRPGQARRAAYERAGGACDRCRTATSLAWGEAAHRLPKSGGGRWIGSNIAWLCAPCHRWCHSRSTEAYATGWAVRRGIVAAAEIPLVRLDGERVYFDDDWGYRWTA